ncbi:hypothetical protein OG909_24925 [Streptomyces sp. NBC_01754]|uniref:hypothetical protein n=1 Tax=Streptomyces sp. NBC_01754 TaxID=2975930 RepID=UPI002DD81514|nr:hypothetical protein [Streptomyces sp. NBC_01754]WSC95259.1 hypothetical protein OG909_24925 [Streptomyces sp. NBC_01754]
MNTSSQTLRAQSSPVLLLAQLLADRPDLPAVTYHIDSIVPGELAIHVHHGRFAEFEEWRVVLGLSDLEVRTYGQSTWVDVAGVVRDVNVRLTGHGTADEVAAYMAGMSAVAA